VLNRSSHTESENLFRTCRKAEKETTKNEKLQVMEKTKQCKYKLEIFKEESTTYLHQLRSEKNSKKESLRILKNHMNILNSSF
jgi:hypothetical protein